jgi:palmitoyltransferase
MAKVVDRAIWSAGPVFIFIAVALIDMCVLAYYLIVFPYNHLALFEGETSVLGKLNVALTLLFTFYMVYCLHFHYYMSIRTHPGGMATTTETDGNHSEEVCRAIKVGRPHLQAHAFLYVL